MKTADGTVLSAGLFLEQFGFEGRIQHSAVSTLSGGERKRLYLVRLLIGNPNFIILDEPTNDFDIFTMNILEKFLMDFGGCLLIVSHDRYFMDKVADTMFILENDGSVSGFVGKCSEYIDYREEKRAQEKLANEKARQEAAKSKEVKASDNAVKAPEKKRRLSYKEQREFEELEKNIAKWEEDKKTLEAAMADTDYAKVQKAGEEYARLEKELETAYSRWEELAEFI